MGVTIFNPNKNFIGLSTDTKPGDSPSGSTFWEYDTGVTYITYDGTNWVMKPMEIVGLVTDWTAVAQNTIGKSGTLDCSGYGISLLHIQAALDTVTAHTGTRFIVQVSSALTGDEDWQDYTEFIGLVGTAATDLIENNPLAAGATSITLTAHALTALAKWLFIEDATLINSELIFITASATNAITILDGTTNAHAVNTAIFNVALAKVILLDASVYRARVLIDNSYDSDGSSCNIKLRVSKTTSI